MNQGSVRQSLWMLLAGLSFALMVQFIKAAVEQISIVELSLHRFLGGSLMLAVLLLHRRESFQVHHYRLHLLRALTGLAAIICFYLAIKLLNPTIAYALHYVSPLFFVILVALLLRERLGPRTLATLVASFFGVLLLVRPVFSEANVIGTGAGIASGLFAGAAFYVVRRLAKAGERGTRTVFFFNLHGALIALLALFALDEGIKIGTDSVMLVLGLIATSNIGQLALTQALGRGTSEVSAALHYCGVVFSLAIDLLFNDASFRVVDYLGILIIICCGTLTLMQARRRPQLEDDPV